MGALSSHGREPRRQSMPIQEFDVAPEIAGHMACYWGTRLGADAAAAKSVADRMLADVVKETPPPDPVARRALQALIATHGEIAIAEVAAGVGLSLRQLERRFGAAVGLDPVQFAKIRKMRGELT